jgi:hypothetical protein
VPQNTLVNGRVRRLAFPMLCGVTKKKGKVFFFEKKKQKTFMFSGACWGEVRDSEQKFFGSFFQKRTFFSTLSH